MSKYRAYSVYKNSGVECLGDVPEHWTVERLNDIASIKQSNVDKKTVTGQDEVLLCNYVDVYYNSIITSDINFMKASASEDEINKFQLQKNDVIITKDSESPNDIGIAALVVEDIENLLCGYHLSIIRDTDNLISGGYLYYALSSPPSSYQFLLAAKGVTRFGLSHSNIKNINIALPKISEQQQIAVFLDDKTAHLDTLIEKKQQMIGLLNEKRIALITQAVTKGLDLTVPMKDSGVEWLGNVPEHWEKVLIKYLLNSMIDTEHKTAPFFEDGQYFVVRTSNIRNGKLLFNNAKYTDHSGYIEWTRRGKPQAGDILFTREAPAGEACLVPEGIDLCVGQRTVLMQVNPILLNSKYALWSLYGGLAAEFIKILSQGATVAHFNMSDIGNIPILLPLISEQQKIVDYLDHETQKIDDMIKTIKQAITTLQEYRTALITAAVTGKIDVRTLTPHEG